MFKLAGGARSSLAPRLADHGVTRTYLRAPAQLFRATRRGTTDFWVGALARGSSPWGVLTDMQRWADTVIERKSPSWTSEHRIVGEWPVARLRDFTEDGGPGSVLATLVLPPQAGHDSCVVDFAPGQSQIETIKEAGLTRVASLDWIGATPQTKDGSIEDYLQVVSRSIELLGGRVNLVGDCQGGWLAAIYAALHPDQVNTLAIAGAPIDTKVGMPQLQQWIQMFSPTGNPRFYEQLVALNDGVLPGRYQLAGFKAMEPAGELIRLAELFGQAHNDEALARYAKFEDWFEHTQDLPGPFYLWIVEHLFFRNELAKGHLTIAGETVDLGRIACPVYLIAGERDHITPAEQVWALADHVSTPTADVVRRLAAAGHLGLFMGREALRQHWLPVLQDMRARSNITARSATATLV